MHSLCWVLNDGSYDDSRQVVLFFYFSKVGQCKFCLPVCVATVCGSTQGHYFDVILSRKARQVPRDIGQCTNHQETRPAVRERHSQQV